jgi:hypothetical protein
MPGPQQQQIQQMVKKLAQKGGSVENISQLSLDRIVMHEQSGFKNLLEKVVNLFDVIKTIVQKELQLRNMSKLKANCLTQFPAQVTLVQFDFSDHGSSSFRGKDTEVTPGKRHILCNTHSRYRNHFALG